MDGLSTITENRGDLGGGGAITAGNNDPSTQGNLQDAMNDLLSSNQDRPGFMYDNPDIPGVTSNTRRAEPTPQQPAMQQAQAQAQAQYVHQAQPQYDQTQLITALQTERTRSSQLAEKARMLEAYEEALANDPQLADQFVNYFTSGPSASPASPAAPQQSSGAMSPILRRELASLRQQVQSNQDYNEILELERDYPGVFNRQTAYNYKQQNGFRSVKDAFHHLLGQATGQLIQQQHRMQYAQYYGYQPQQQAQAHVPQQYAPQATAMVAPPPSAQSNATVLRPGAPMGTEDSLENYRPNANPDKGWKEVQALMMHDMTKWKQQGLY